MPLKCPSKNDDEFRALDATNGQTISDPWTEVRQGKRDGLHDLPSSRMGKSSEHGYRHGEKHGEEQDLSGRFRDKEKA